MIASDAEQFERAFRDVRSDSDIQFSLPAAAPPQETPEWLLAIGRAIRPTFEAMGQALKWVFDLMPGPVAVQGVLWLIAICLAIYLVALVIKRVRQSEGFLWWGRSGGEPRPTVQENWAPDEDHTKKSLNEAEALADKGRFGEAIHTLLLRSIDEVGARRPPLAKPSITSRELAASPVLPSAARDLFHSLASKVETSFFGGRPVSRETWVQARAEYDDLASAGSWQA